MDDEEIVEIIIFLSQFCKFSIYGEGIVLKVNDVYFQLCDSGISKIEADHHDFAVTYEQRIPKRWDEIIMRIRNGHISVLGADGEQLRARTVINKILTQFI